MRFAKILPLGILAAAVLTVSAGASTTEPAMTKHVNFASPERTVMTMNFNEAAVISTIASLEFGQEIHNGYGAMLAISGSGKPSVRVMNYELGDAIPSNLPVAEDTPATPSELIHAGEPVIMHGLRMVPVAVTPVLMDAAGIARVVRNIEFEVEANGGGMQSPLDEAEGWSSAFEPLYRTMVDNLDEVYPNRSLAKPGRYLILSSTRLLNDLSGIPQFQNWVDLKRRKGYMVELRTLTDVHAVTGDSTENAIRGFIDYAYHQSWLPDLEYALMLGDVSDNYVMPSRFMQNPEYPGNPEEVSVGDNYFFAIDGDDYVADVFHGRISAQSIAEYVAFFAKAVRYENDPYRDNTQWFESATFVAGNFADGSSTFPVTPVWNVNWAREALLRDGLITDADTFYTHDATEFPGQWTTAIGNDIEAGVCAVFYRGWADYDGWQYPRFNATHVEDMLLGRKNPVVFSIVCGSGNYAQPGNNCMGETFTSGVGTTASPNGAIMFFGASDLHTNTRHNNACLAGIIRALQDGVRSSAALTMAGKLEVIKQFPLELGENGLVHFYGMHVLNLLGDPETQIYFGQPELFTVEHPATLTPGLNMVTITVRDDANAPVENATVTLRNGASTVVACVMTDENGEALLPANLTAGTDAQLLVWRSEFFQNYINIPVASTAFDPRISGIDWDAGADQLPNPGETVSFYLAVENRGTAATTMSIAITSDDPRVTVSAGTANSSEIQPGVSSTVGPFTIELVEGPLPDGSLPALNVQFTDGASVTRLIQVPVSAPDPQVWAITVNDADGILSPSETATVSVSLVNRGSAEGSLTANVHSFDSGINITNGNLSWGNLPIGEIVQSSNSFTAQIPGDVTPGRQIVLRFGFNMNGITYTHKLKLLVAGEVDIHTPTGPDSYGYYAYEDIDGGFDETPTYQWIELNPDSGGTGAQSHEMRDDTHIGIALPSAFQFYGESYDSLWICSNGWISFETATIPEFRNWEIPSPIGPPSMVCVFWDDLISFTDNVTNENSPHNVYTRNDGNRFIVQWQTLNRRGLDGATPQHPSTDYCTFEAILEYSGSGDDAILCQYKQVSNIDITQNYATLGIQNSDHTDGLGLTYANSYLASVDSVRAGRAIRYSTTAPDGYTGVDDDGSTGAIPVKFALHPAFPNPFNPMTELRFDLSRNGQASLRIYDMLGREAAILLDHDMTAGSHSIQFNASTLPTGLYFARLTSGENAAVQKLMLVK